MFLGAGGAAFQMGAHPGNPVVGIVACQFQLDVDVELLEALLAGEFGSGWTG